MSFWCLNVLLGLWSFSPRAQDRKPFFCDVVVKNTLLVLCEQTFFLNSYLESEMCRSVTMDDEGESPYPHLFLWKGSRFESEAQSSNQTRNELLSHISYSFFPLIKIQSYTKCETGKQQKTLFLPDLCIPFWCAVRLSNPPCRAASFLCSSWWREGDPCVFCSLVEMHFQVRFALQCLRLWSVAASANGGIFLIGKVGAPQEQEVLTTPQVSRSLGCLCSGSFLRVGCSPVCT